MAERKLNFNAPLLSTRRLQMTAVSVRRNKKKLIDDDFKNSECPNVPVCNPDSGLDQITEPASVPFTWEQAPGRLKGDRFRPEISDSTQDFVPPRDPPGKVMDSLKYPVDKDFEGQNAVRTAFDGNVIRLQSLKGKQVRESDDDDDDDDDDVFSDALDTLSPKDSCSVNHSISGVSGYGTETKKPLILAGDPQPRDFMLNRFLPAAKAMTVEQPQYASKRQPSPVISKPTRQIRDIVPARQIREIVPAEMCRTPNRYESIIPPYYHHDVEDDEDSGEDEGVSEFANSAYMSKRGCGLLPQLCFRNSLDMLNKVPGLKAKPNSLITSSHNQVKSSKVAQLKSRIQSVKKLALDSVYKQKLGVRPQSPMHPDVGKKFNPESEQLGPNLATVSRSSSPYRNSGCMSPYRSAGNSSPLHPVGFPGTRKEAENLRANRLNKHIKSISRSQELIYPKSTRQGCSTSSVAEKTVYVDTESFPITNNQQNSNVKILPETIGSLPHCVETVSEEVDTTTGNKPDANLELDTLENISISSGKIVKADEFGKINSGHEPSLLAPPLPKKPSESWLLHNLPSVSSQIPSRRSPFHPQRKNLEEKSSSVTKWETMVKTSYMHKDHIRYSEELVAHTCHRPKT